MRRRRLRPSSPSGRAVIALLATGATVLVPFRPVAAEGPVPGRLHVRLRQVPPDDVAGTMAAFAAELDRPFLEAAPVFRISPGAPHREWKRRCGLDRWIAVSIPEAADPLAEAAAWAAHPAVEAAEPAPRRLPAIVPSDPLFAQQWEHENTGGNPAVPPGTPDADLDTVEAWDLETGHVRVSNVESVDWYHEDLAANVWQNLGEDLDGDGVIRWDSTEGHWVLDPDDPNALDDDGNGYVDDLVGWNFAQSNNRPEFGVSAHGTATAGFLLARPDNGIGVAGVCWDCELVAASGDAEPAIVYAVDNGARVISLSFTSVYTQLFADVVEYAHGLGAVLVAAAGNAGLPDANGMCENGKVLCVTATNHRDEIVTAENTGGAWATNHGALTDVGAPGIHLTYLRADAGFGTDGAGTSDATPLVAGVAALVLSRNPSLSPEEVASILQSTADPFVAPDRFAGTGRVNARRAVEAAAAAATHGSFPVASIETLGTAIDLHGTLVVRGTAASPDFASSRIRIGIGLDPPAWIVDEALLSPVVDGVLHTIDVGTAARLTEFRVELEVADTNGQQAVDAIFPLSKTNTFVERPGWPITMPGFVTDPALGDLDGDGSLEIVVKTGTDLFAYDLSGTLRAGWPRTGLELQYGPPPLLDLDGDGGREMIVAHREADGAIAVFGLRQDGTLAPGWPQPLPGNPFYQTATGDLDGDGVLEVVQLTGFSGPYQIHAFGTDGGAVPGWPVPVPQPIAAGPVLADLDGDGDREIVVRTTLSVFAWEGDGSPVPGWALGDFSTAPLVAGDLDADGRDEIVRVRGAEVFVHEENGTIATGWPRTLPANAVETLLGDVDGDGALEVVIGTAGDEIHVLEGDATTVAGFPPPLIAGTRLSAIADVDGDGAAEPVFFVRDEMHALSHDGTSEPDWPIVIGDTIDAVALDDLDGDGELELLVGARHTEGVEIDGVLHVFDLVGSRAGDGWLVEHRDATNGRRQPRPPDPTGAGSAVPVAGGFRLGAPRPNPARTTVRLDWSLPARSAMTLAVYDVAGRRVRSLVRGERLAGSHHAVWDGRDRAGRPVASGVYLVLLEAPPHRAARKVVEIRR